MQIGDDIIAPDLESIDLKGIGGTVTLNGTLVDKEPISADLELDIDSVDANSFLFSPSAWESTITIPLAKEESKNNKNEGGDKMNKVLDLYKDKEKDKIYEKYNDMREKYMAENETVKKFTEIFEKFQKDMDDLYESDENKEKEYIVEQYDAYMLKYKTNGEKLLREFNKEYNDLQEEELDKLSKFVKEVDAQLSLSDDLDYQLEVLTRYGIIDKKTKKMVD